MDVGDQLGMRLSFLDSGAKEEEQLGDCQSCSGASMQSIGKGCKTGKLNQHGGLRCDSVPACTRQEMHTKFTGNVSLCKRSA